MRRAMKCAKFKMVQWRSGAAKIGATLAALLVLNACGRTQSVEVLEAPVVDMLPGDSVGADRTTIYLPLLKDKRVAVLTNQSGLIGTTHLVDSLLALNVDLVKVFAPEHGFRGDADAGEHVKDGKDLRTGLNVISLYGSNKKPGPDQLVDVDVILFDLQDVGARFYTYISTLHYVMEAAAENKKQVIILDRYNPNGFYVDGPVLDPAFSSFVGLHPIPIVHGMTIGEYAHMINGEGWLKGGVECQLAVITCANYRHDMEFAPQIPPSPNLPNAAAIWLYPSLCLFEGTIVSVGRGTDKPFQCIGYPRSPVGLYKFTPKSVPGAKDPPYLGKECTGMDLQEFGMIQARMDKQLELEWLIEMYSSAPDKAKFFNPFFDKLAGGTALREAIIAGKDEATIRASWQPGLEQFKTIRAKYLLYPDFTP